MPNPNPEYPFDAKDINFAFGIYGHRMRPHSAFLVVGGHRLAHPLKTKLQEEKDYDKKYEGKEDSNVVAEEEKECVVALVPPIPRDAPQYGSEKFQGPLKEVLTELDGFSKRYAKILFTYESEKDHWVTGEIIISRETTNPNYKVEIFSHVPKGGGQMGPFRAHTLKGLIKREIEEHCKGEGSKPEIQISAEKSPYAARQHSKDKFSSGVIAVEDMHLRLQGESLTRESFDIGALRLRQFYLDRMTEFNKNPRAKKEFHEAAESFIQRCSGEEILGLKLDSPSSKVPPPPTERPISFIAPEIRLAILQAHPGLLKPLGTAWSKPASRETSFTLKVNYNDEKSGDQVGHIRVTTDTLTSQVDAPEIFEAMAKITLTTLENSGRKDLSDIHIRFWAPQDKIDEYRAKWNELLQEKAQTRPEIDFTKLKVSIGDKQAGVFTEVKPPDEPSGNFELP